MKATRLTTRNRVAATPAAAWAEWTQDAMTLALHVEDLCCTKCAIAVETPLVRCARVRQFRIRSAAEMVQEDFHVEHVSAEEVACSITAPGYQVRPTGEAAAAELPASWSRRKADAVRFAFIALVALIAPFGVTGEYFDRLEVAKELLPVPVLLAAMVLGGYPIFRRADPGLLNKRINMDAMMRVAMRRLTQVATFTCGPEAFRAFWYR